jgi:hypothetical protein
MQFKTVKKVEIPHSIKRIPRVVSRNIISKKLLRKVENMMQSKKLALTKKVNRKINIL